MSLAIFNMSSSIHATVVIRHLSCKQHEGRTADFTCNTRLIFYMYSLTVSFVFEKKSSQSVSRITVSMVGRRRSTDKQR